MSGPAPSEVLRKLVHIGMAGFALLLRWIPWWMAAVLAGIALISNATWIPRLLRGGLMRSGEREAPLRTGVFFYALSVLLLVLIFRHHLEVAAGAWGILAFGDGAATLLGRGIGGPRLPWNSGKSWIGSAAFLVFGTLGGGSLLLWVGGRTDGDPVTPGAAFLLTGAAALAGAVVESLALRLDDNLSVGLLAGGIVYSLRQVEVAVWTSASDAWAGAFGVGLAVTLGFALVARSLGTVSWSGVAGGLLVGTTIATFTGLAGFAILALFFVLGSAATRLGYRRKAVRGIAEARGGARGVAHAIANCGVGAYLAFLAASTPAPLRDAFAVAFVAAMATAACDTLGSEVGPLGRGKPILITRLRRVPAGTPGAVSLLGTAAGLAGAFLLGALAALLGLIPAGAIGIVVVAAFFGTLLESVLGATLEPMGLIGSETVNFVNTLAGALAALGLIRLFGGIS